MPAVSGALGPFFYPRDLVLGTSSPPGAAAKVPPFGAIAFARKTDYTTDMKRTGACAESEEECARSIAQMREYRESMNASVSDYLYIHAETFNEGLAAMDRAILEGDVNGFIRGNVAIQEILNYKIQFRDQNEFDALMDADTAFVL